MVTVTGLGEIQNNIDAISKRLSYGKVGSILLRGAKMVQGVVRSKAPRGKTGNLARGVISKVLDEKSGYTPVAIVAPDYKISPHAHLVEYGTKERFHKSGKSVGKMKKKPFYRPGWDETKYPVLNQILNDLKNEVEK